jgi:hypothetical protein
MNAGGSGLPRSRISSVENLIHLSGSPAAVVQTTLLELELPGLARRRGGLVALVWD